MLLKDYCGSASDIRNRHDITLADQEGKNVGGVLRKRLAESLGTEVVGSQCGDGFGGASCDVAHLGEQAFGGVAASMRLTLAKLYVDVVQAFASIIVSLILPLPERHGSAREVLRNMNFTSGEVDEILNDAAVADEWSKTAEHMRYLVAAMQRHQWMATDFDGGVLAAHVGTAAGVPLAGIVAVVALSKITRKIRAELHAAGLALMFPTADADAYFGGGFEWAEVVNVGNFGVVDDDVFVLIMPAERIVDGLKLAAGIIFGTYEAAGLKLHLKESKTAAVVTWHGTGSRDAAQALESFIGTKGGIPFLARGRELILPATSKYKHLGCWARADGKTCTGVVVK